MNRTTIQIRLAGLLLLLPLAAAAQVEKQVEVTKNYIPEVAPARKLAIAPDLTDTVKIRPDIDYRVEPKVLSTHLTPQLFRPARVTYWEFNRAKPCYLKLGAGYPLNSVGDLYLSTHHPDVGYAVGYLNHRGEYARIRNFAGEKLPSTRMHNRAGVAGGRYVGRHLFEASLTYDNDLLRRYGVTEGRRDPLAGKTVNFGDAQLRLRIGDDFDHPDKVNFNVEGYGNLFYDNSATLIGLFPDAWQCEGGGEGRIGFRIGRHLFFVRGSFDGTWGLRDLKDNRTLLAQGGLRYGFTTRIVQAEVGADYLYARSRTADAYPYVGAEERGVKQWHRILPWLRLRFSVGRGVFVPFVEVDTRVGDNSFGALMRENPYTLTGLFAPRPTIDYSARGGLTGDIVNRFTYRAFIELQLTENARYWYGTTLPGEEISTEYLQFGVVQAPRKRVTIGGELGWRPVRDLQIDLSAAWYMYDFQASLEGSKLEGGEPLLRAGLKVNYTYRRLSLRASADAASVRKWSNVRLRADRSPALGSFRVPFTVDVGLGIDVRVSRTVTLFAEGTNLANMRLYDWANYPLQGIACTAGVKLIF